MADVVGLGEPPLGQLLKDIARARLRLGAMAVLGAFLTLLALWIIEPRHTAYMLVGPTTRLGPAGMGPALPIGTGGLPRALAEPGSGEETLSDYARYLELLMSHPVAARVAADEEILRTVFHEHWDADNAAWREPVTPGFVVRKLLFGLAGLPSWSPPDAEQMARYLRETIRIERVGVGPIRRIVFRHRDRDFALRLLAVLHAAADGLIREEAGRRILVEIDYLRGRLADVTVQEHRVAMTNLLGDQERIRMMISVDLPFAADTIAPPTASALPDWPDPIALLPFGALVGFVAGLLCLYAGVAWTGGRR